MQQPQRSYKIRLEKREGIGQTPYSLNQLKRRGSHASINRGSDYGKFENKDLRNPPDEEEQ